MKRRYFIIAVALMVMSPALLPANSPKRAKEIVIALVDTGVDTTNSNIKELFKRDGKGYIVGWNFLGDKNNTVNPASIGNESFRVMQLLHGKYGSVTDTSGLNPKEKEEYANYRYFRSKARIDGYIEFAKLLEYNYNGFKYMDSVVISQKGHNDIEIKDLNTIDYSMIPDSMETQLSQVMSECTKALYAGKKLWQEALENAENEYKLSAQRISTLGNPMSNPRFSIGDNPYDFDNLNYGNKNIAALPNDHATEVMTMIAGFGTVNAKRRPKVMPLRVAAAGEAFDKDIYSAIMYAANNGANMILIPQAKEYSLHGSKLAEAIEYAGTKGIIVVAASADYLMEMPNLIEVDALEKDGNGAVVTMVAGEVFEILARKPKSSPAKIKEIISGI
ncbi:MAG: S8 family serine peptidase [Bacteroidales bacterium]|jgi:subtilisin family serine protease|nr:S8 family serine peptidase [Bacteroidales bacterium]MDD3300995.1 S8 family serine peptidase [Bacteroidales bacterium]